MKWAAAVLFIIVLSAGAIRFNSNVLEARLDHLDLLLERGGHTEGHGTTELVGRYRLILNRLENGEDSIEAFRTEAQLAALAPRFVEEPTSVVETADSETGRRVEHAIIALLRRVTGKPPVDPPRSNATIERLSRAYLLERSRRWTGAIALYEQIIADGDLNDVETATIRLHLGFCYSMAGDVDHALEIYHAVLSGHPGTETSRSAAVLIDALEAVKVARAEEVDHAAPRVTTRGSIAPSETTADETVPSTPDEDALAAGRTAFRLLEYDRAITLLDDLLQRPLAPTEEAQARYYRARALEERGDFTAALAEYQILRSLPDADQHPWDLRAQRRTAMIQAFYADTGVAMRETTPGTMQQPSAVADALASSHAAEEPQVQEDPFLAVVRYYADVRRDDHLEEEWSPGAPATSGTDDARPTEMPAVSEPVSPATVPAESADPGDDTRRIPPVPVPAEMEEPPRPRREHAVANAAPRPQRENTIVEEERPRLWREVPAQADAENASQPRGQESSPGAPVASGTDDARPAEMPAVSELVSPATVPAESTDPEDDTRRTPQVPAPAEMEGPPQPPEEYAVANATPRPQRERTVVEDETPRLRREPPAEADVEEASQPPREAPSLQQAVASPAPSQPPRDRPASESLIGGDPPPVATASVPTENTAPPAASARNDGITLLGTVIHDEEGGLVYILPEDDSALERSDSLVIYRMNDADDGTRVLVATATAVARVPPRLIARVHQRFGDRTPRAGDRVFVLKR